MKLNKLLYLVDKKVKHNDQDGNEGQWAFGLFVKPLVEVGLGMVHITIYISARLVKGYELRGGHQVEIFLLG